MIKINNLIIGTCYILIRVENEPILKLAFEQLFELMFL